MKTIKTDVTASVDEVVQVFLKENVSKMFDDPPKPRNTFFMIKITQKGDRKAP